MAITKIQTRALVAAVTDDITANSAKTGITSGQASAITANTAKVTNSTSASDLTSGTLPDARFPSTLPAISGSALTGIDAVVTGTSLPSPVSATASLFYKTDTNVLYISDGTQWKFVSNAPPATTGGTVTISALDEQTGTFSYNLGIDFEDDSDTDAELTYTLNSGTMPAGCTLPTAGNSAFTGTSGTVSSNTNYTWTIKATDTSGATTTQDYQQTINNVLPVADFLVVAGGGGNAVSQGGLREAGSGAGGLRTSYGSTSGGGASAESALTLTVGAVYSVTVGAGGNGHVNGSNSSISGTGISTITSSGGGSGGQGDAAGLASGHNGGSGGGRWYANGVAGTGTAGQGFNGSVGFSSSEYGGAGGGAGGAGGRGGVKGLGLSVSITGNAITYATGGAANDYPDTNRTANGAANTGEGASGSGNGGSGVVILRVLTIKYTGTTTGSPTVTTTGLHTVIKFTGNGSYTA